jgi:hypothetical protein
MAENNEVLQKRLDKAILALKKYGKHGKWCDEENDTDTNCDCGFKLAQLEAAGVIIT